MGLRRLADDARHQGADAGAGKLANLDRENLRRVHLRVEKLHHAPQFRRDQVYDEHQAHFARLQVRIDSLPERLDRVPWLPLASGHRKPVKLSTESCCVPRQVASNWERMEPTGQ